MTIRHLTIFIAVADTGKMSAAAKQLYIAQPTVSQTIAEIESYYGIRLFERLSKKLYITPAGEQLLSYARHIVSLFEEMERGLRYTSQYPALRVGATITVGSCVLADIVNRFEEACPGVRVEVFVDNSSTIEEQILKSELDLALVEGKVKNPDLVVRPVIKDELVLICGQGHPFTQKEAVTAAELEGQPFILREPGSGTRELLEDWLEKLGIGIDRKWVCHSSNAIISAVEGGQGLSVISRRLVEEAAAAKKIHMAAVSDMDLSRDFSVVYHKNKFLSPPFTGFMEACKEEEKSTKG